MNGGHLLGRASASKLVSRVGEAAVAAAGVAALGAAAAHAGADTTFTSSTTMLTNWTTGSMGKLAAVAAVGAGIFGAILRFDWKLIAGAVGIGLAAATGPGIVSALVTATF